MPEFHLDTSGVVQLKHLPAPYAPTPLGDGMCYAATWRTLDAFTQGYIEALFFTEEERLCEESNGARHMPDVAINTATMESHFVGGDSFAFADLAPETLARIIADCAAFQASEAFKAFADWRAGCDGDEASDDQAGRDFWFTRNGHGVGFWDRPVTFYGTHGEALTTYAQGQCNADAYLGDDGKVYLS